MKSLWGTDTRCRSEHAEGEKMLADAEAKVDRLKEVLDDSPARNLDEALVQVSHLHRS